VNGYRFLQMLLFGFCGYDRKLALPGLHATLNLLFAQPVETRLVARSR
jgi:hypothetical protein